MKQPDISEFSSLVEETRKWAKDVGMTEEDIDEAVKLVRKTRRVDR